MNKKYICLSHILSRKTPSYGNRDALKIDKKSSINLGDVSNTSSWIFSNNHIGTHIDTPYHFNINGKKSYDFSIDEFFYNKVTLIDIPCENGLLIYPKN